MAKRKNDDCPAGQFGPVYNVESAALKKYRRNGGDRQAYGQTVLEAVLTAQAGQLRTAAETIPTPNCASRTLHNNGRDVLKAVRAQLRECRAQGANAATMASTV